MQLTQVPKALVWGIKEHMKTPLMVHTCPKYMSAKQLTICSVFVSPFLLYALNMIRIIFLYSIQFKLSPFQLEHIAIFVIYSETTTTPDDILQTFRSITITAVAKRQKSTAIIITIAPAPLLKRITLRTTYHPLVR